MSRHQSDDDETDEFEQPWVSRLPRLPHRVAGSSRHGSNRGVAWFWRIVAVIFAFWLLGHFFPTAHAAAPTPCVAVQHTSGPSHSICP